VRSSARRSDDADVIRARLRAVLAEMGRTPGWVPPDDLWADGTDEEFDDGSGERSRRGGSGVPLAARRGRPVATADEGGGEAGGGERTADDRGWVDDDRSAPHPDEESVDTDRDLPAGLGRHRAPGVATRLDPGRSGARALWLAGLLAALLVAGWTWADRPQVETVPPEAAEATGQVTPAPPATATGSAAVPAPATAAEVVVSVVGQVARPGLVTLPAGSRVADALAAAGGLLPDADPAAVNAAAVLTDGQQIAVGVPGAPAPAGPAGGTAGDTGATSGLLALNTATVTDLDALPGIGPVLAQRIVDHRSAHGPFTSVEQLDDVSGIGPAIYAELAARVTV
jgi:competence protein ComEA